MYVQGKHYLVSYKYKVCTFRKYMTD